MVISYPQSRASRTDRTRLKEFKEGTASDDKLQILISTVLEGSSSILDKVPAEFKDFIIKYNICSWHKLAQPREPLIPYGISSRPWKKIDADLFLLDQCHYLITVDYYSSFSEVDKLDTTDSTTVIEKLKIKCSLAALEREF